MSQRQAIHICFYSNRCKWSKAFIQELSLTPFKTDFKFICIDPSPNRPALPAWLKSVPTIVISGEPEPRMNADVMNWLYEQKMKVSNSQQASAKTADGTPGGEPMGWSTAENVSFSKGFGYSFNADDTTTGGAGGLSIPGAFSFLNGGAAPGDRAAQEFPGSGGGQSGRQKSKKEEIFDKQMEAYQRSREEGMPKVQARN